MRLIGADVVTTDSVCFERIGDFENSSAPRIGSHKPSARLFDYMIEKLQGIGVKKEKILHTAESMFHDHKPANDHGLKSCWVYRRHAQQGFGATMNAGQMQYVDFKFNSMLELVKANQEQLGVK
jgi:2-haloacid dehalogenase